MSPFYTQSGDDGYTSLLGKDRVAKDHPQIEAVGVLDETTAAVGLARSLCQSQNIAPILIVIQRDLYRLMAEVVATPENAPHFRKINTSSVTWLEGKIGEVEGLIEIPDEFILPGDTPGGAALALARTIVRRAERRISELFHSGILINNELLRYLNRLSSLLFVLELLENQNAGKPTYTLAKEG